MRKLGREAKSEIATQMSVRNTHTQHARARARTHLSIFQFHPLYVRVACPFFVCMLLCYFIPEALRPTAQFIFAQQSSH